MRDVVDDLSMSLEFYFSLFYAYLLPHMSNSDTQVLETTILISSFRICKQSHYHVVLVNYIPCEKCKNAKRER